MDVASCARPESRLADGDRRPSWVMRRVSPDSEEYRSSSTVVMRGAGRDRFLISELTEVPRGVEDEKKALRLLRELLQKVKSGGGSRVATLQPMHSLRAAALLGLLLWCADPVECLGGNDADV